MFFSFLFWLSFYQKQFVVFCVVSFDEFGMKNIGLHGFRLRNISYGDSLKVFFCNL